MILEGTILQLWSKETDDFVMYKQTIVNKYTNEKVDIKSDNLTTLMIKVNDQIKEWIG
jgi:hypothetical protein